MKGTSFREQRTEIVAYEYLHIFTQFLCIFVHILGILWAHLHVYFFDFSCILIRSQADPCS